MKKNKYFFGQYKNQQPSQITSKINQFLMLNFRDKDKIRNKITKKDLLFLKKQSHIINDKSSIYSFHQQNQDQCYSDCSQLKQIKISPISPLFPSIPILQIQPFNTDDKISLFYFQKSTPNNYQLEYKYKLSKQLKQQVFLSQFYELSYFVRLFYCENYSTGLRFLRQEKYHEARICFQFAMRTYPGLCCLNNLAYIYFIQKEYRLAVELLERAIFLNPRNPTLINNMGIIFAKTNLERAIKDLQLSVDIKPDPQACSNLATAYFYNSDYGKAAQYFQQSLSLQVTLNGLNGLASAYSKLGRAKQSLQFFTRANTFQSNNRLVMNNFANFYLDRGNIKTAHSIFQEAISLYPFHSFFYNGLANVQSLTKDTKQCQSLYQKAISLQNNGIFHSNYSIFLIKTNRSEQAINYLCKKIIQNTQGEVNLVEITFLLKDKIQAEQILSLIDLSLKKYSKQTDKILNNKGCLLANLLQYQSAKNCFLQALSIKNDPKTYLNIGCLEYFLRKSDDPPQHLLKCTQIFPDFHEAYYYIGSILIFQKQFKKSLTYLNTSLKLNDKHYQTLNAMGVAKYYLERYEQSLKNIEACLQLNNEYRPALNNKAILLISLNINAINLDRYFPTQIQSRTPQTLYNHANELLKRNIFQQALPLYQTCVELRPVFAEAWHNLGYLLMKMDRRSEGVNAFKKSILLNPEHYQSYILLAIYSQMENSVMQLLDFISSIEFKKAKKFKFLLNKAIVYKIANQERLFYRWLEDSFTQLDKIENESNNRKYILEGVNYYLEIYSYLAQIHPQSEVNDLYLMMSVFYHKIRQETNSKKYLFKYFDYQSQQGQNISDTFINSMHKNINNYSKQTNFVLINFIIYKILNCIPDQGMICYLTTRTMNKNWQFDTIIIDEILNQRAKKIQDINFLLNGISKNNINQQYLINQTKQIPSQKDKEVIKIIKNINVVKLLSNIYRKLQKQNSEERIFDESVTRSQFIQFVNIFQCNSLKVTMHSKHFRQIQKQIRRFQAKFKSKIIAAAKQLTQPAQLQRRLLSILSQCLKQGFSIYEMIKFIYNQLNLFIDFTMAEQQKLLSLFSGMIGKRKQYNLQEILKEFNRLFNRKQATLQSLDIDGEEIIKKSSVIFGQVIENVKQKGPDQLNPAIQQIIQIKDQLQVKIVKNKKIKRSISNANKHQQYFNKKSQQMRKTSNKNENQLDDLKKCQECPETVYKTTKSKRRKINQQLLSLTNKPIQINQSSTVQVQFLSKNNQFQLLLQNQQFFQKKVIVLSQHESNQNSQFFQKLIYLNQIILIQKLSLNNSPICNNHKILTNLQQLQQKCRTFQDLNQNYFQFRYGVKHKQNQLQQQLLLLLNQTCQQTKNRQLQQLLCKIANIFIQLQKQGIHHPHQIFQYQIQTKSYFRGINFRHCFQIYQKQNSNCLYQITKQIVTFWLKMDSNPILDQIMIDSLLKGLPIDEIYQFFDWKLSIDYETRIQQNEVKYLGYAMKMVERAMKIDHFQQFTKGIKSLTGKLKCNQLLSNQTNAMIPLIEQIVEELNIQNNPYETFVKNTRLLSQGKYGQQKQINFYLS